MKLLVDLRKVVYATLLLLLCALLFSNQQAQDVNDNNATVKGHFISATNHPSCSMVDDDHTNPADNEEDEDDDENGAESLDAKSYQEFIVYTAYHTHQDRLFYDPHGELVSPPPKF